MTLSVAIMTSSLGELSAGNLYHYITVGQWFFYDWLKISSAQNISSALNRRSREFKIHKLYCMVSS